MDSHRECLPFQDGEHTGSGDRFIEAIRTASSIRNVKFVGINCTSPLYVTELLQRVVDANATLKPFILYPNGGETYDPESKRYALYRR
jgi:homocysteine S-methyltransferase